MPQLEMSEQCQALDEFQVVQELSEKYHIAYRVRMLITK